MAVKYEGEVRIGRDELQTFRFSVEDLNKLAETIAINPNPYPYVTETKTYIGTNTSTVIRTLTYTLTDEEGRTQTVSADVLHDGTIHIDPSAFSMLMKALGYKDDNTYT